MPTSLYYAELTPPDFLKRISEAPIAYLPLGTLEWHGPHLPLGADGIQPIGLFEFLARDIGGVILPTLFVGPDCRKQIDGQDLIGMDTCPMKDLAYPPQKFPGSAYWIDDEVFIRLLDTIVEQLARAGFRIIVGHGHGPSTGTFSKQADRWKQSVGIEALHCFGMPGPMSYMGDHAALIETSITLAVRPELVQMANLPAEKGQWPPGVGGHDPRAATAEHGLAIVNANAARMKGLLTEKLRALDASRP